MLTVAVKIEHSVVATPNILHGTFIWKKKTFGLWVCWVIIATRLCWRQHSAGGSWNCLLRNRKRRQLYSWKEVLMQFWCVFYSNFYLFHSGFLMFLRHMAVPTGGPTAVHLGQIWRASQLQQITWITSRRLSQYPTPAKKTSMTCDTNNGLWSARGLMISNSLTACGDWGCRPGKYDEITTVFMLGWNTGCVSHGRQGNIAGDPQWAACHLNMAASGWVALVNGFQFIRQWVKHRLEPLLGLGIKPQCYIGTNQNVFVALSSEK